MTESELQQIHGSTADELDQRRLKEYFSRILGDEVEDWHRTLLNRELVVNAFAHRDWTRQNDIRLTVFRDRM